jgi:flagellar assembly protein FliH
MSSRICRTGEATAAQSIQWRSVGAGAPALAPAGRAADRTDDASREREIEARIAAAYQQGVTTAEASARLQAQTRLEPVLAGLTGVTGELAGMRKKFRREAEEATVALAIAIARRVLHRELSSDPDALLGLVKAAFQKCDSRETHKLRLSPQDAEAVRENRGRLNLPPAVEIAADGSLTRGSAIFETSRGELDASLDTQLSEIERGLTDVLSRRTR